MNAYSFAVVTKLVRLNTVDIGRSLQMLAAFAQAGHQRVGVLSFSSRRKLRNASLPHVSYLITNPKESLIFWVFFKKSTLRCAKEMPILFLFALFAHVLLVFGAGTSDHVL